MSREEILKMISDASGVNPDFIDIESTLLGDLGIDGDDASDLLEQCQRRFKIDFSNFEFIKHFRNEPCYKGFLYIYRKWKFKDEHVAAGKVPITVSQLIKACESGQWCADV